MPHAPAGRTGRLAAAVGRHLGDRLVSKLVDTEALAPRWTAARTGSYVIAAFAHLLTFALGVGGIALIALTFPNPFLIVLGIVLASTAFFMRPRLGKVPKEDVVDRLQAPATYRLADDIAGALGLAPIDLLVVEADYNASWQVVGFRRRRVLTLGLPLIAALDPQELVALVAHELAHARNGDAARGLFVGSAVNGLAELYGIVGPEEDLAGGWEGGDIFGRLVNWVLYVVSRPVYAILLLQLVLVLRDAQRAELLADVLAAEVAGTAAVVGLHEKSLLEPTFDGVIQRAAHARDAPPPDVFAEFADLSSRVPERERERRRRVARLEGARLIATHPPTSHRIDLLEKRPVTSAVVQLTSEGAAAIDRELEPAHADFQRRLVDDYRDRLYYA